MEPKWIWTAKQHENQVCCFYRAVTLNSPLRDLTLELCADTRCAVYWNGHELGRGPVRSAEDTRYYDSYTLDAFARAGENSLCVRVWHYGWSTYQSIAAPAGLWFRILCGETVLAVSDEATRATEDAGHKCHTVKRNVNLGFMEYQNASLFAQTWLTQPEQTQAWAGAVQTQGFAVALLPRPIPQYHTRTVYPVRVEALREVRDGCMQISVNTREAFFPGRTDANETIFCGFLGCVLDSAAEQAGELAFPNRTWHGLIGDFTIDGVLYPITNAQRSTQVRLKQGRQLFLMQISGKYDDLYCHLELNFSHAVRVAKTAYAPAFFVIGPTDFITPEVDGFGRVYGGLQEFNRFETFTPEHAQIFAQLTCEHALTRFAAQLRAVPQEYVFQNEYLLSLARRQTVQRTLSVDAYPALLYDNTSYTTLPVPAPGCLTQLVLDFGELYIGSFTFTLDAAAGTVLDIYCYENNYGGTPDFATGLNNALRYVCAQGAQTYTALSRMGCRYAMLTLREQTAPVRFYRFALQHSTYPASGNGRFSCNDESLNRIWQMAKATHELCMEDTFTDCPTFEQAFWIGDAQISAAVNAWLSGSYPLIRHCLCMGATAAVNTPMFNALTPTDWNTSIPMWAMNWVISVEQYVQHSGDTHTAFALYDEIAKLLRYYAGFITPEGALLIHAWNMLDWAAMDIHNHGVVTGQQGLLAYCMRYAARLAQQLGCPNDAAEFCAHSDTLLHYIDIALWNSQKGAFADGFSPEHGLSRTVSMQTHSLLCLFDAIVNPQKRAAAEALLLAPPKDCLTAGSPFILYYLYEHLAAQNRMDAVVADIREKWLKMARYDCTTCWEVFPGFYENSRTRSYCHSWSSQPVYFFQKYLLGASPVADGFARVCVSVPQVQGLTWCEGSIPTPKGTIAVAWSREQPDQCTYRLRVPEGIEVEWALPTGWKASLERV